MENLKEKLNLAIQLRKNGLSLKKIQQETGISFRDLSVIFKYINSLEDLELKNVCNSIEAEKNFLKKENEELKEKLKELEKILNRIEKEKKDLAINLSTAKYSVKIIKPVTFITISILFLTLGIVMGIYLTGAGAISNIAYKISNLEKRELKLKEAEAKLKASWNDFDEYLNQQIKQKCYISYVLHKNKIDWHIKNNLIAFYNNDLNKNIKIKVSEQDEWSSVPIVYLKLKDTK